MKKKIFLNVYFLIIITAEIFVSRSLTAQVPSYKMFATNITQPASNIIEFDIYLLRTGSTPLELAAVQVGLQFDSAITKLTTSSPPYHSYVVASYIAGSTQLNVNQAPPNQLMASVKANGWAGDHVFKIVSASIVGAGNGTIISNSNPGCSNPGMRVGRFRITNQQTSTNTTPVPFNANTQCNGIFGYPHSGTLYHTAVFAYLAGQTLTTDISDSTQHYSYNTAGTCFNNLILNPTPILQL